MGSDVERDEDHAFTAELWRWSGEKATWVFLTVPDEISDDIEARTEGRAGGFGSVRVEVTIGSTTWRTSVFPDSKRQAYVLPVKRPVRVAEGVDVGSVATVRLRVLDL